MTMTETQRKAHGDDISRRAAERRAVLQQYKIDQGCVDCGYNANPLALDFDHVDPNQKSFAVMRCLTRSWANLWAEVAKCVVRCANCHRIQTHAERHNRHPNSRF